MSVWVFRTQMPVCVYHSCHFETQVCDFYTYSLIYSKCIAYSKNIIGHDSFAEKFEQQHENNTTTTTWHPLDCHCTPLGRLVALEDTSSDSENFVSRRGERSTWFHQCRMMTKISTFKITGNNTALCCKTSQQQSWYERKVSKE